MSCFGCCEEDDAHKAADYGGHNTAKHFGGISIVWCMCFMWEED